MPNQETSTTELPAHQIETVPSEASRLRVTLHCSALHYLEIQSRAIHFTGSSGIQSALNHRVCQVEWFAYTKSG